MDREQRCQDALDAELTAQLSQWKAKHAWPSERVDAMRQTLLQAIDVDLADQTDDPLAYGWWARLFEEFFAALDRSVNIEGTLAVCRQVQ